MNCIKHCINRTVEAENVVFLRHVRLGSGPNMEKKGYSVGSSCKEFRVKLSYSSQPKVMWGTFDQRDCSWTTQR